jgi:hypothetical protein
MRREKQKLISLKSNEERGIKTKPFTRFLEQTTNQTNKHAS